MLFKIYTMGGSPMLAPVRVVMSVSIVTGDSKTLVGRPRPANDVTKKTLCVTPPTATGDLTELDDSRGRETTPNSLARAAEQRNLENGGVPVPPRRRAVVGEGPARYTYLRSGDINKC